VGNHTGQSDPGNSVAPGPVGASQDDPTVVGGTRTHYDSRGHIDYEISADKSRVTHVFDGDGNTTSEASTVTGTTTSVYGIDDRQISQTNQSGFTTSSAYDMLGQVIGATGASQSQTQTEYNTLGWVLQTVDANGVTTLRTYDAHGVVTDETIGTAGTTHSTYDVANRLLTLTDPNGDVLTNTYDVFGNRHEESHQDWSGIPLKDVVTNYDSLGRATSESESVSGRSHTWTYPVNTPSITQETVSYDASPLTSTQINRNVRGMETSRVTTIASGTTLTRTTSDSLSGRDQADCWTGVSLQLSGFGALTIGRSFDDAGRITTQSGAGFASAGSYTYNATSGLKSNQTLPLALGGAANDNYTYSLDGRLHTWGAATYTYDGAGNLTGDGASTFTYGTSGTPNRLVGSTTGGATTVYGWDQGNSWRTSQGPTNNPTQIQYTYVKSGAPTSNGRMTRYQNSTTSTDAGYAYDASGQRVRSAVTRAGVTTTTTFVYDGLALLRLSATQNQTSWRIDYLYDEEGTVFGGVYRSPASSTSPTYFTMITNDHGDVLELLDANGVAFASYRYDPWGLPLASGTTIAQTSLVSTNLAGEIAARQVLRYASYAYDSESGLYYCSARYYDPTTRQWTTGDPAKADGESSAYQYCADNPVGLDDPTGLDVTKSRYIYVEWGPSEGQRWYLFGVKLKWHQNSKRITWCGVLTKAACKTKGTAKIAGGSASWGGSSTPEPVAGSHGTEKYISASASFSIPVPLLGFTVASMTWDPTIDTYLLAPKAWFSSYHVLARMKQSGGGSTWGTVRVWQSNAVQEKPDMYQIRYGTHDNATQEMEGVWPNEYQFFN
jgi:RHS repeat-associated protein